MINIVATLNKKCDEYKGLKTYLIFLHWDDWGSLVSAFTPQTKKKTLSFHKKTCKGHDAVVSLSAGNDTRPAEA